MGVENSTLTSEEIDELRVMAQEGGAISDIAKAWLKIEEEPLKQPAKTKKGSEGGEGGKPWQ